MFKWTANIRLFIGFANDFSNIFATKQIITKICLEQANRCLKIQVLLVLFVILLSKQGY
jgi:hypothetical protein